MSTLPEQHRTFKQQLSENPTKQQLWNIVKDFIKFYSAEGIKEELWLLTVGTLTSDHMEQVKDGIRRHNRLFFYEHSTLFIDAVNQLYQQQEKKKAKRKSKT